MPGQGDVTRILGNASFFWKNVSVAFFCANHSKYHVGVDMHKPEGKELIRQLAARSDIVIENFKAGRLWEHDDPVYGPMVETGPAPKLSATPARIKWAGKPVGFHNDFVFKRILGLDDTKIRELEAAGAVGQWAPGRRGAAAPDGWKGEGRLS